ncbi:hypothetical protein N665_0783s0002, partial [Sinapis alba]
KPINHSVPSNNISLRHFVEHLDCHIEFPTFSIEINQRSTDIQIISKAATFHMGMYQLTIFNRSQTSTRLQRKRVRILRGSNAVTQHLVVQIQSFFRVIVGRVGSDHYVPRNRIGSWVRNFVERVACKSHFVA